jgi:hypothetical protein
MLASNSSGRPTRIDQGFTSLDLEPEGHDPHDDFIGDTKLRLTIRSGDLSDVETFVLAANDLVGSSGGGIAFIDENGGGPGVRLRKPTSRSGEIQQRWLLRNEPISSGGNRSAA